MSLGTSRSSKHLRWSVLLFLADFFIVWISFATGVWIRFGDFSFEKLQEYGIGVAVASLVLPSVLYIGGGYSPRNTPSDRLTQVRWLLFGLLATVAAVLMTGSLVFTSRVGRGVLAASILILVPLLVARHLLAVLRRQRKVSSYVCLVAGEADERAAARLFELWAANAKSFGLIVAPGYEPLSDLRVVERIGGFDPAVRSCDSDVILIRERHLQDPEVSRYLRLMRYEGIEILSLADVCEDVYHVVPLELVTDAWLFRASLQSQLFYIRKLKRFSDVVLALVFLILLSPFLGLGALLVRLSSPGPLIFRQERVGRFGRPITVLKLRTMHVAGPGREARWADQEKDRIFPLGKVLRTFRVDEIPQLVNVLRGEMSFVGPRPEQRAIVEELDREIPFYRERLAIQPGITGWAQVNYPYGASVEDSARKLEYDLYYLKHMGILLDLFILLETVKIILIGGLPEGDESYLEFRGDLEGGRNG